MFSSFDEFGDSFSVPVTPEQLRDLFNRLPNISSQGENIINQEAYLDLKKKYKQFSDYWRFALKEMHIFSADLTLPILSIARLYGARLTDNEDQDGITHHIVGDDEHDGSGLGAPLTKFQLLELLKPHISEETYSVFK